MEPFANIVITWKPLTFFAKSSILDNWLDSYYASGISKVTLCKGARKGKRLAKAYGNWSGQIVTGWLYGDIHHELKSQLGIPIGKNCNYIENFNPSWNIIASSK